MISSISLVPTCHQKIVIIYNIIDSTLYDTYLFMIFLSLRMPIMVFIYFSCIHYLWPKFMDISVSYQTSIFVETLIYSF